MAYTSEDGWPKLLPSEALEKAIVGKVVDGEYKATWTVEDDGKTHTGEWTVTVKCGG